MKKKVLIVFALLAVLAVVIAGLALAGELANDQAPDAGDADSIVVEDVGVEESDGVGDGSSNADGQGYVGVDGSGAIDPDDYETDEEYQKALIESGEPEFEVPHEEVSEKQDGERYDHGYEKYLIDAVFYTSFGEERAHEIVESLGGVWVSDTFAWPSSQGEGEANVTLYFKEADTREELDAISKELMTHDEVRLASASTWFESSASTSESSSLMGYTVNDPNANLQSWLADSGFNRAWEVARCSGSVEVAILDSGIDLDHPDLVNNIGTTMPYDAFNQTVLQPSDQDTCGHGTLVAGVVAAVADNSLGIAGGSYNAKIIPVRVNSAGKSVDPESVVRAFKYLFALRNTPEVVNMSFAGPEGSFGQWQDEIETLIKSAINDYGMVCVAASGNTYDDASMYPAAFEEVVSVGALGKDGVVADFSTRNVRVDLCASGELILSTSNPDYAGGELYSITQGTSLSAPQVAAAAALLKAQHPDWQPDTIEQQLEATAIDLGTPGHDWLYGYGSLDAAAAVGWKASSSSSSSPNTGGSAYAMLLKSLS